MIWFRSRIRSGAQLALFALAFQMAVSFGHMHRDDLGLPPLIDAGQTHFDAGAHTAPAQGHRQPTAPDDYCPICASMALIATAIPSLPPMLVTPGPNPPRLADANAGARRVGKKWRYHFKPALHLPISTVVI